MRALIQRVNRAWVEVEGKISGQVEHGLLVYVSFGRDDMTADVVELAKKITALHLFNDENGKLSLSTQDVRGGVLVVPNFTLMDNTGKCRQSDCAAATDSGPAKVLYEHFVAEIKKSGCFVVSGIFGAKMQVASLAHGPINIVVDMPPRTDTPLTDA